VKTKEGSCDWTKLGVGASDAVGDVLWCCSDDALILGLCEESSAGRMIINAETFGGEHRPVIIPPTGDYEGSVQLPVLTAKEGTGTYTLVIANCNDYGRNVLVEGKYIWRSKGGFLPGNMFEEWHFFIFLTFCYCGVLFWYGRSMYQNKEATIGIQKWVLGTIILGLIEIFFKTVDYLKWNQDGIRDSAILYLCKYLDDLLCLMCK